MIISSIELVDFRNYREATFELRPGTTAIIGANGQGKTNLAEAMAYLATLESFRGAPLDALIRVGSDTAVIRATVLHDDGREVSVELELSRQGRNRVLVNRQRLQRARDLLGVIRVTVFSPDDLAIVKEGPAERRRFLDDVLVALALKYDALRLELDRILRQRNVLLKQCGGRLDDDAATTLDVWDAKFATVGEHFGLARSTLVDRLAPFVGAAYDQLADRPSCVALTYHASWRSTGLAAALHAARGDDVRRGVSTVGPHRDDVELSIDGMPARTHASQGEQRTLALALRLGAHRLVSERVDTPPVLVLDDVLSELDAHRATALLEHLPAGQVVLTTAGVLPNSARPDAIVRIEAGIVVS